MDLEPTEIRVLGCLLEKQRTTPDAYPLSLNALRLACNQATNREPVVDYDEGAVRDALHRLGRRRWTRLASGAGSRAPKYRHLLDEALPMGRDEQAVVCVLMLRGPQTPGELKQRTERMHAFRDLQALGLTLERLIGRGLVARLERRPGQKEERYRQLLGGTNGEGAQASPPGDRAEDPARATMRQLTGTVVFTDLVSSTEILSRLQPHEAQALRSSHLTHLQIAVSECDGQTVKTLGDGLMAIFAAPSRAIEFAVAAQQHVSRTAAGRGAFPGLKVGISVGEVIEADGDYQGRAIVEAARLCELARAGQILIVRTVRLVCGRLEGVAIEDRGSEELQGLPGQVHTEEIIWPPIEDRPLRVLLADDAVLIRQGLARLLEDEGFAVVGQTGDATNLLDMVAKLAPDVLITDVRMPPTCTLEGLEAALRVRAEYPRLAVLVLSQHLETRYAVELLGGGASGVGYLLKERIGAVDEFVAAVRRVAGGGTAIDPEIVGLLISRSQRDGSLADLSAGEEEILGLMAQGLSDNGIARRLALGTGAVETHLTSIFGKLGLLPEADDERRVLAVIRHLRG